MSQKWKCGRGRNEAGFRTLLTWEVQGARRNWRAAAAAAIAAAWAAEAPWSVSGCDKCCNFSLSPAPPLYSCLNRRRGAPAPPRLRAAGRAPSIAGRSGPPPQLSSGHLLSLPPCWRPSAGWARGGGGQRE